ncbi:hypothetical protein ACWKTZ_25635 [Bacillus cereus]
MDAIKDNYVFRSYDELLKDYVNEKFELVHYELVLDSLYMSKDKNDEWKEKRKHAIRLYEETKENVDFFSYLLVAERERNIVDK